MSEDPLALSPFVTLIRDFLAGRIDADAFERGYLRASREDGQHRPRAVFLVLDTLFADVDAYCPDPALRGPDDLDAAALREAAARAAARLEALGLYQ
ncbi:hypothetical protein G3576_13475 [Roseomonas stagni]|uniref:Colicin D immunity protein domain-containing protein n=1 Tax=Falsiroseomonas algicola TaxID=2716930 RepID=A0A6M1LLZ2_9PROT|nr:colicin immunity domain-containing protein [Falsiroseomonas algicola]NGM21029.1 hypothetical protein [Falsiroseomonas algicola]